ncbi:MAG: acyltransferase domain-containing protein [Acidimicrobiales bacterium]
MSAPRDALADARDLVAAATRATLDDTLAALGVAASTREEVSGLWSTWRADAARRAALVAALSDVAGRRGDPDAPLAVRPDAARDDVAGRIAPFYLFALDAPRLRDYLTAHGVGASVVADTLGALARHAALHQRRRGVTGVDAAWWMVPILRGVLVQVGSLQYHRVRLGVGSLSPRPWYSDAEARRRGAAFETGAESIGLHVPDRTDLSPRAVDASLAAARRELGRLWPSAGARVATCQSWLLDDRLVELVGPTSRLVAFARRFALVPGWLDGDDDVATFVLGRRDGVDPPPTTRLARAVVRRWRDGDHWRVRTGWLTFDGA